MSQDAYVALMERRARNGLIAVAEDMTDGEIRVMTMTPGQLQYIAEKSGNPLCELIGEPVGGGRRRVALGPTQLDFLARLVQGDEHPMAVGLDLILDLEERIVAGQGPAGITSHDGALVTTSASGVLVIHDRLWRPRGRAPPPPPRAPSGDYG